MLLTFEQSLDMARERYQTLLAEVSAARKAQQARTSSIHRLAQRAGRAFAWLRTRLLEIGQDEPTRVAGA